MDDEDIREAEESRYISTTDEFSGFGTEQDALRKGVLADVFRPTGDTIGVRLLKRMGWKEGQGVGPRIKRAVRMNDGGTTDHDTHLFAPENHPMISLDRKTDYKGIGYSGEAGLASNEATTSSTTQRKQSFEIAEEDSGGGRGKMARKSAPKSAFGVGVLNDTGSDDEDPYSVGPKISYNRTISGDKKPKKKGSLVNNANPLLPNKPVFIPKKLASLKGALRKCHDGRLPPDGFNLGDELECFSQISLQDDNFKPQDVPEGWKSSLKPVAGTNFAPKFVSAADAAKASNLDSKSRAAMLGEAQLPGKSVFDFLTPAARDHLAAVSGKSNLPPALGEKPPDGYEPPESVRHNSLQDLVPQLDIQTAIQALNRGASGYMPYAEDQAKRARYRAYLQIRASASRHDELPARAPSMDTEDWTLELKEFARAAQVFKPITGLMASRFTSSAAMGDTSTHGESDAESLLRRPAAKAEDPAEVAAKMGMFGTMTRSVTSFLPSRLLCKRFNVPLPDPSLSGVMREGTQVQRGTKEAESANNDQLWPSAAHPRNEDADVTKGQQAKVAMPRIEPTASSNTEVVGRNISQAPGHGINPEKNYALEKERPGQALFKAIFGDDDEDEEE